MLIRRNFLLGPDTNLHFKSAAVLLQKAAVTSIICSLSPQNMLNDAVLWQIPARKTGNKCTQTQISPLPVPRKSKLQIPPTQLQNFRLPHVQVTHRQTHSFKNDGYKHIARSYILRHTLACNCMQLQSAASRLQLSKMKVILHEHKSPNSASFEMSLIFWISLHHDYSNMSQLYLN